MIRRYLFLLTVMLLAMGLPAEAQRPLTIYMTASDSGERLVCKGAVPFTHLSQPDEHSWSVMVDPSHRFQTIEGIGGALTDAAAETWGKLPAARQDELIAAYYDQQKGIGYTLGRTHINSCDFSSHMYTYVDDGDSSLRSFSIAPDLRWRVPFIRRILQTAPQLKIFASPWSPPAWMKTNADMLHGGSLKPQCYDAWARYFVKFIEAYQAQRIPIWGLTVQNEPMASQTWESCIYTAEEERDFVKGFLGPALHRAGLDHVKLMIWDHNRGLAYQRGSTVLADREAARYVWGTAFHWYVGEQYNTLSQLHESFPQKAVFFSEGCNGPFDAAHTDDWKWAETYATSMINDFNHWSCGWTDWNILLDENGGPNHVGNFCFAPVLADTHRGTLHYTPAYFYIGHFSKFVRGGARRLACTTTQDNLLAAAFLNPDGDVVTITMNPTGANHEVQVWSAGQAATVPLPPHSIVTLMWSESASPQGVVK